MNGGEAQPTGSGYGTNLGFFTPPAWHVGHEEGICKKPWADVTEKFFVRVDVTEEFPFVVTRMSLYDDR